MTDPARPVPLNVAAEVPESVAGFSGIARPPGFLPHIIGDQRIRDIEKTQAVVYSTSISLYLHRFRVARAEIVTVDVRCRLTGYSEDLQVWTPAHREILDIRISFFEQLFTLPDTDAELVIICSDTVL